MTPISSNYTRKWWGEQIRGGTKRRCQNQKNAQNLAPLANFYENLGFPKVLVLLKSNGTSENTAFQNPVVSSNLDDSLMIPHKLQDNHTTQVGYDIDHMADKKLRKKISCGGRSRTPRPQFMSENHVIHIFSS